LWWQWIFVTTHALKRIWQHYTTLPSSNRLTCCQKIPCHLTPTNSQATTPIRSLSQKTEDPFILLEEHFFKAVMACKKCYGLQFEDLSGEVVELFS
jgi:hypothetical protein